MIGQGSSQCPTIERRGRRIASLAMPIKITYFNIEGAAEPVRLALAATGQDFEDVRINFEEWQTLKPTTKFGALPLMEIDGKVFAQSAAMLRYVGKSFADSKLYPQEGEAFMKVEEAIGLVDDFNRAWTPCMMIGMRPQTLGYPEDFSKTDDGQAKVKELREGFVKNSMPTFMQHFTRMLEENQGFLVGGKLSIADLYLLPALRRYQKGFIDHVPTTALDEYTSIIDYIKRVMAVPEVAVWYAKAAS